MRLVLTLVLLSTLGMLSACANEKVEPQHSPCVGIDNSPCGPKRPINGTFHDMSEQTPPQPTLNA